MALSETTDALGLPRPADDGSDPFDTTDLRTQLNTIDAQFDKGGDVASATSITVPDESYFDITGTTTTTAFSTVNAGVMKMVQFDGACQLTHNSSSFNLPTGANITTAAGDRALFRSEGSGNWRCMWFQKATGAALKIADNSIDSDAYVDGSIDAAHIAADAVTAAKIGDDVIDSEHLADDALDSEHYTDGSIDAAHLASNAVTTAKLNADAVTAAKIGDDVIDSEHYVDGSIDTPHIANDAISLAKLASGTDGELITWDASGDPATVAVGTATHVLTSNGAGAAPTFQSAAGGGKLKQHTFVEGSSAGISTSSDSYVDITDMKTTLTTTGGNLVARLTMNIDCDNSGTYFYVAFQLDSDSEEGEISLQAGSNGETHCITLIYTFTSVSSAEHVVDARWHTSSSNSLDCDNNERYMELMEVST